MALITRTSSKTSRMNWRSLASITSSWSLPGKLQHAAARVLQRANLAKTGREVELLQQETGGGAAQGEEEGEAEGQDPPFAATASAVPHPAVEALVRGEPSSKAR